MKPDKHLFKMSLVLLIILIFFPIGCTSPAKKLVAPDSSLFSTSPLDPTPAPMPRYPVIQISPKELVDRAVNDAENINGVNKAYAFVSDKIIYIGLDLNEDGSQSQSAAIEREARSKIESLRSGYTVRVTTDGNTVTLIRTVNQGLAQGQAFSDFNSEVHSVVVKMTPKGSGLLNLPVKLFYILGVHSGFI